MSDSLHTIRAVEFLQFDRFPECSHWLPACGAHGLAASSREWLSLGALCAGARDQEGGLACRWGDGGVGGGPGALLETV